MASSVLTVSFLDGGRKLSVSELDPPAILEMPVEFEPHIRGDRVHCVSWQNGSWFFDSEGIDDNFTAVCPYSHFTDFAAFVGPPPKFNPVRFDKISQLAELRFIIV